VGIGWQGKSCMACDFCLQGEENLCLSLEGTCVGHYGGYAEGIKADGRFAFLLPEKIPSAVGAPLLCGGATVFSPFVEYKVTPMDRVAVLGIGGLGHLALQFARGFGCETTAISSSKDKEAEAKEFGANHFICTKEEGALEQCKGGFDLILTTSSAGLDVPTLLATLAPKGKLCFLGVPEKPIETQIMNLVDGRKKLCGSNIASRPVIKKMLEFALRHNVAPKIEEFPLEKVNEAIAKVRANQVRYRAVLRVS